MAFAPSSTIYLCNVPFDATYKNQIMFDSVSAQRTYFTDRVVKTFSEYLTVRKTLPSGAVQSSVKVKANIDDLYNCNYMCYQNANHGEKFFYAFIVKLIYINENTTEVIFETDVFQTWMPDVKIMDSFVVREHSETDEKGKHIIPESFNIKDYEYQLISDSESGLGEWGYLIGASETLDESIDFKGRMHSGIFQGMYFYYLDNIGSLNQLLAAADSLSDCIQFITYIPKFCLGSSSLDDDGKIQSTTAPAERSGSFDISDVDLSFGGYTPKNNKLYSSPFMNLCVTNHNGSEAVYEIERFDNETWGNFTFKMYGDISCNPSVTTIPLNYRGAEKNFDFGISLGGFPQCAYNADAYKLWLAKNQFNNDHTLFSGLGYALAGAATIAAAVGTGGTSLAFTGGALVSGSQVAAGTAMASMGVNKIGSYIGSHQAADHTPNSFHSGRGNNLLSAIGQNKFHFYIRKISSEFAKMIDEFFTMYGYQTNRVKKPNLSSRKYFNYIQTEGINIVGAIPNEDMVRLKAIFDNGVTLWKPNATVGDYSVDNTP